MKHEFHGKGMGKQTFWFVIVVAVFLMAAFCTPIPAAEPDEKDEWEFALIIKSRPLMLLLKGIIVALFALANHTIALLPLSRT